VKKLFYLIEQGFVVAVFIIFSGAFLDLILSGGAQENEFVNFNSSLIRVINLAIYVITFCLLVLRWRKTIYWLTKDRWIFPLIVLAGISILWSYDKAVTLKDVFTLVGSSLFGVYLASRYTLKQLLYLLAIAHAIMLVMSFAFAIAIPRYGRMGGIHQGKWRGVFLHKNGLGARMIYSCTIFLILAYQNKKYSFVMWILLGLSALLMILASSASSIINLGFIIVIFYLLYLIRLPYLYMVPAIAMLLTVGQIIYFWYSENANFLFSLIGKDATLTGRTDLWPLVIQAIGKHPWLGYGYSGFWQGVDGVESAYLWRASGWTPTHPHNGFLALCLDLGLLGLAVFLLGLWRNVYQGLSLVRMNKMPVDIYPILHTFFLIITNVTESNLLASNSLTWILYVSFSLYVAQGVEQRNKHKTYIDNRTIKNISYE
jgi:exopolysaccharide production protein ExoQ